MKYQATEKGKEFDGVILVGKPSYYSPWVNVYWSTAELVLTAQLINMVKGSFPNYVEGQWAEGEIEWASELIVSDLSHFYIFYSIDNALFVLNNPTQVSAKDDTVLAEKLVLFGLIEEVKQ